jgi:hypothetical protein
MAVHGAGPYPASLAHVGGASGSGGGVTAGFGLRLLPQPFEPVAGNSGVMGGVLRIAVAEIILHGDQA